MANNPKKVKDPTEVALSAIQEALNISDTAVDPNRNSIGNNDRFAARHFVRAPGLFRNRRSIRALMRALACDRPVFDPIEEPRAPRRAANDDRETIGQIAAGDPEGPPCPQRLHARHDLRRHLARRLRAADRQLPALAAGRDGPERRRAGARRPCRAVLCAGAAVLFPRQPCLARPGNAHDRAIDGAGRDPLLRARRRRLATRWSRSARRSAAKSPRWATASSARSRAPANWKRWSPTKSRRSSAPIPTTKCASARCCRTSPISATTWSARPSRSAAPFPACRSTCATTSR